jgi:hypothetical protein
LARGILSFAKRRVGHTRKWEGEAQAPLAIFVSACFDTAAMIAISLSATPRSSNWRQLGGIPLMDQAQALAARRLS